ncbi:transmembrane and ubiquitin-like domain-containing protein 1 [Tympanuchus pallidicinctus]|uniref:transmembrane and ubiquitin-like domain-containing protein 1 n=1 Tax=Lagopus leucura TaxID=30410 RepID=UPI001C67BA4A|nr:transmembrane and ubiquitin-like domain-containing protein 1 [Lagopus leucura]XP_042749983.1 transmembrane and ubiquitin-like domain-containing protein 1 [Lagopus leucura]XP_048807389.1 transmembrane and ubiquitin-like domain-containing protein 1 [Lagopus muta]XP_052552641.1 transmembrane and ubiquitin-like domain-containing protein 1 [Tympanuchus pallidicinctus]
MALIEGVGDEVTALFALLLAVAVLALAWASTRAPEPVPPPRAAAPLPEEGPSAAPEPVAPHKAPASAPGGAGPDGAGGAAAALRARGGAGAPQQSAGGAAGGGPAEPTMVLRLKFLNDTERLARVRPGDTVGALKRTYFPGQEQQVRLIYQGQLLRDDAQSLAALHLAPNSVLHCHISQHSPAPAPAGPRASADPVHTALNVGSLMLPLFVLMLAVLWYFQLQYRHVFTATATTFLAGLTLLFSFMAFTMYRR